ncbi:MAG TPA: hypothetical protein VET89_00070 [Stellaceae bacterium]|nr:hypothetical protein [Stellaceae bacterium]
MRLGKPILALVLASVPAAAEPVAQHAEANGLAVDFTVMTPNLIDIRGFVAKAALTNLTAETLKIDGRALAPAALALEFRGPDGARVLHCSPPAPPPDDGVAGRVELLPKETAELKYDAAICIALRPGRYQVRLHYANSEATHGEWVGDLTTDWATFVLR